MDDNKDQQIAELLEQGVGVKKIRKRLSVGYHRVNRIKQERLKDELYPKDANWEGLSFDLDRVSDMRENKLGKPVWYKWKANADSRKEALEGYIEGLKENLPRHAPIPPPQHTNDLCAVYPMGDPHLGMRAWKEESGEDFNIETATSDLLAAVDNLVSRAPPCKQAVIVNTGDAFHYDNKSATTARSGHILDKDLPIGVLTRIGMLCFRQCVETALKHHERVEVINAPGNHDEVLAHVLSAFLAIHYENEPRVNVQNNCTGRHYFAWGKNLIGAVHGHETKDSQLPILMALEMPQEFANATYKLWLRGHLHHDNRKEVAPGVYIEMVRTLAAGDQHATSNGYRPATPGAASIARDMKCMILDPDGGEVSRLTCSVDMIRNQAMRERARRV